MDAFVGFRLRTAALVLSTVAGAPLWTSCARTFGAFFERRAHFTVAEQEVSESAAVVVVRVEIDATATQSLQIPLAVSGSAVRGVDFSLPADELTIPEGARAADFSVTIIDDQIPEPTRTIVLTLAATDEVKAEAPRTLTLVIADDDTGAVPVLSIADVAVSELEAAAMLTVTLSQPVDFEVNVGWETQPGGSGSPAVSDLEDAAAYDYVAASGVLAFAPGETGTTIQVTLRGDALPGPDVTFVVALQAPRGAVLSSSAARAIVTIIDDDALPTVSLGTAAVSVLEPGTVEVKAVLDMASGLVTTVPFTISGSASAAPQECAQAADYELSAGVITIAAGQLTGSVTVTVNDDELSEPDESLTLTLTTPTNATLATGGITSETITVTANDPPVTLTSVTTLDLDGNARIDTYKLDFSSAVDEASFPGYSSATTLGSWQDEWRIDGVGSVALAPAATLGNYNGVATGITDGPVDATLYLRVAEGPKPDTGETAAVSTATACPGLAAAAGAMVSPVVAGAIATLDGAPPALVAATSESGLAHVYLFFSEPIWRVGGSPLIVTDPSDPTPDLAYANGCGEGASTFTGTGLLDGTGRGRVVPDVDVPLVAASLWTTAPDEIQVMFQRVQDVAGNLAPPQAVGLAGIVHPYLLGVVSTSQTTVRVDYSEPVWARAIDPAMTPGDYTITGSTCGNLTASAVAALDWDPSHTQATSFVLTTPTQTDGCVYTLTAPGAVADSDEDALLVAPTWLTFVGQQQLTVLAAEALSLRSFVITFSKPVRESEAEAPSLYTIPSALGAVVAAVVRSAPHDNEVVVTHSRDQGGAFYTVLVATTLHDRTVTETLQPDPFNQAQFLGLGGNVTSIEHGALYLDPFADGSAFAFVFTYGGKVYAGPNDSNTAVVRFDADGGNFANITFKTESGGSTYPGFGLTLVRPVVGCAGTTVTVPAGVDVTTLAGATVTTALSTYPYLNMTQPPACTGSISGVVSAVNDTTHTVTVGGCSGATAGCLLVFNKQDGPDSADGVDAFVAAPVASSGTTHHYLAFGPHRDAGGGVRELYLTRDLDRVLDGVACDLSAMTIGNTKSLQAVYGYGDQLYYGFATDHASKRPLLAYSTVSPGPPIACSAPVTTISTAGKVENLPYVGVGGVPANPAPFAGIDSMVVADLGSGARLYIANNGGVARSRSLPPAGSTVWDSLAHDGPPTFVSGLAWTSGTTRRISGVGKLRPGEKGVPAMIQWGSYLFVARNRSDNDTGEVWRYDNASFMRVFASAPGYAVSLLTVSGKRLYIGLDDLRPLPATTGAQLWRTQLSSDGYQSPPGTPADVTPALFTDSAALIRLGVDGLGPQGAPVAELQRNKQILSNTAIDYSGKSYLYLTVGCADDLTNDGPCDRRHDDASAVDFAMRVYRQVE